MRQNVGYRSPSLLHFNRCFETLNVLGQFASFRLSSFPELQSPRHSSFQARFYTQQIRNTSSHLASQTRPNLSCLTLHVSRPPPTFCKGFAILSKLSGVNGGISKYKSKNTNAPNYLFDRKIHVNDFAKRYNPKTLRKTTRDDLLKTATGFWSRSKLKFKWFSIRSGRPFNADELGAFFSWLLLGHVIWIILGTTTFVSLAIFTANTVMAQETLARKVGNYLTQSIGVNVVFESAIVPNWKDGVISFRNVFVSRRPGHSRGMVQKGSLAEEAALAATWAVRGSQLHERPDSDERDYENTNYAQYDLVVDTINVTLSFRKWFNGKGLLHDVDVKGVRGVVDRSFIKAMCDTTNTGLVKHERNPGDFEICSFNLEDLLVTVHQPGNFRPFSVSVYNCSLSRLRRQWLFYDFLAANVMSGSFDNSLFTIHPAQSYGHVGSHFDEVSHSDVATEQWRKQSRLRIDKLNIDHLNRGISGPISWIREGSVDIVADINFPVEKDESMKKVVARLYERLESMVIPRNHPEATSVDQAVVDYPAGLTSDTSPQPFLLLDLRVHLNDVRAAVPIFNKDLSYANNALIRPIVAYMNSQRASIPLNCRVVKRIDEFDGSWTIYDSGLMDDLSVEAYQAFAQDVMDNQARMRRLRKVGFWSLQLAAQALFMGLAGTFA